MTASPRFLAPAKVRAPQMRAGTVDRIRLIERLDDAFDRPGAVGLVCAPAGWGKTTLLNSWLSRRGGVRAWLQLDAADNDPNRFGAHLAAAADVALGGTRVSERAPAGGDGRGAAQVVRTLIETLDPADGFVLVLDDYHVIGSTEIHAAVDELARWMPVGSLLVLSSRAEPPLTRLPKLRLSGLLTEIRAADLAFSIDEAAALLASWGSITLSEAATVRLLARTEGWAAGLSLAMLSMERADDGDDYVERLAGDDRMVADYLRTELIGEQTTEVRDFLVRSSVLDELTGPACDSVLGVTGSVNRLRDLERENLLIVPLDAHGRVYRYHHLLVEWLRAELALEPGLAADLHRRAARFAGEANDPEAAMRHALAAPDLDFALTIAEASWRDLLAAGRYVTLDNWLTALDDQVRDSPTLCAARVQLARNTGAPSSVAQVWLERAERIVRPDDVAALEQLHISFAIHHRMAGDLGAAEDRAALAIELAASPGRLAEARSLYGATITLLGRFDEAIEHLDAAATGADAAADHLIAHFSRSHRSYAEYESGGRGTARQTAEAAVDTTIGTPFEGSPILAAARITLASLAMDDGDLDRAGDHVEWALTSARRSGAATTNYLALLAQARLESLRRHGAASREVLEQARTVLATMPDPRRLAGLVDVSERQLRQGTPARGAGAQSLDLVEDLTERELGVLRLLASDLTIREIGSELFVSHNTVKGHVKAIYRKLAVSSRDGCVARARELGLL